MAHLELALLGPFQATLDQQPITDFRTEATRALLAYLATRAGEDLRRDALATLLWPEQTQEHALNNLRQTIHFVRRALNDLDAPVPFLLVTPQTLQFNPHADYALDVNVLASLDLSRDATDDRALVRPGVQQMQAALALYRGEFLAGMTCDSAPFEEWLTVERERWHQRVLDVLERLTTFYARRAEWSRAREYASRQIELEPWREEAHRALMLAYARLGQRSAALAQYAVCQRALAEAFGAEPSAETLQQYRRIAAGEAMDAPVPAHNLPAQATSFVGRQALLAQICDQLLAPTTRLVTLTGPGGIGKTRLALAAADALRGVWRDGVWFVSFAEFDALDARQVRASVADAANDPFALKIGDALRLPGANLAEAPLQSLVANLRAREILLVLDNLEPLAQHAAPHLAVILRDAPNVVILATARQPLNLLAETVVPVPGLTVPASAQDPTAARADSVQLFVERARRVAPNFELNATTLPSVIRLCQVVGGTPLIIELAAARAACATPDQITDLIQNDADTLDLDAPDLPERHRSLRALFASMWTRLSDTEKSTLAQTTIFRDGFDVTAAKAIIAGDWNVERALSALVAQALLQRDTHARLTLHPTVEHLLTEMDKAELISANLAARHSAYYLQFLASLESQNSSAGLSREWRNVLRAWDWAAEHSVVPALAATLEGLTAAIAMRGEFLQGERMIQHAVTHLHRRAQGKTASRHRASDRQLLARLWIAQADMLNHAGRYDDARVALEQAAPLADELDDALLRAAIHLQRGNAELGCGGAALAHAEFEQALTHARASFTRALNFDDTTLARIKRARALIADASAQLAECTTRQKRASVARQCASTACDLYSDLGGAGNEIRAALVRAAFLADHAEWARARQDLSAALTRAHTLGDQFLQANVLFGLGQIEMRAGKWTDAQTQLERALEIASAMDGAPLRAAIVGALAQVSDEQNDPRATLAHSQEALALAEQLGGRADKANALAYWARAQRALGHQAEAQLAEQAARVLQKREK